MEENWKCCALNRIDYLEIMGTSYSDAPTRYNYRLSEEENLFRFYFSIFERLIKKIDLPFTLRADGFATDSQPQLVAIREALVNLLMHCDYFSPMKPRIRVFLDRIEFLNPGSLPKDIESIIKEDFTMPRNPIIAKIFRVIKLSENAGSGFDKMFSGWKSYYEIEPEVSSNLDHYKITFPLEKTIIPEKVSEKIIKEVQKNQYITIAELAEIIGVTPRSIERNIQKLQADGVLQRVGPDKGGYWKVIDRRYSS
jgi:ATP-dependent DNA helicase RecG